MKNSNIYKIPNCSDALCLSAPGGYCFHFISLIRRLTYLLVNKYHHRRPEVGQVLRIQYNNTIQLYHINNWTLPKSPMLTVLILYVWSRYLVLSLLHKYIHNIFTIIDISLFLRQQRRLRYLCLLCHLSYLYNTSCLPLLLESCKSHYFIISCLNVSYLILSQHLSGDVSVHGPFNALGSFPLYGWSCLTACTVMKFALMFNCSNVICTHVL